MSKSAEQVLVRVDERLRQVQFELSNWITMPTAYGIIRTHRLEDEKCLMLEIRALPLTEIDYAI